MPIEPMIFLTVIRIAKEYDIEVTLDHATDARCIVEQIKESGFPCICGPSFGHKTKFELKSKSFETPGVLNKAGILVSITTDSPVIPEQYLSLCAALAAKKVWMNMKLSKQSRSIQLRF